MTSISLTADDRNALLDYYHSDPDSKVRLRAHILLLLADNYSWAVIATVLFTSPDTIARWKRRFGREGVAAVLGRPGGRWPSSAWSWAAAVVAWVLTCRPAEFGFACSRWCFEAVAVVQWEDHGVPASRETVPRCLRRACLVWRRPRPALRPKDPDRPAKLAALRRLLANLPDDETAVFQDEVEVHTNPKVGSAWIRRGEQARRTPFKTCIIQGLGIWADSLVLASGRIRDDPDVF